MPLPGTPAPPNKRKKLSKIITDLSNITQADPDDAENEALEFDLGTKIKTPKDLMLEELSLLKNKGSKMFKRRQQRVEKFIITNENLNLQSLVPSLGCELITEVPCLEPEASTEVDAEAEKERRRQFAKTYESPWERAMKGDEALKATMKMRMPGPHIHKDLPQYKSFNRTALPFGGFDKASKLLTFEVPQVKLAPVEPVPVSVFQHDICSRPSFNRTPIGWVCNEESSSIHTELETMPFDGETDDL